MRKRSSKGGGEQRSIQVHLMVNEEEAGMIRTAAKKRNQTVSLTIIEAVKLLEGRLQVKEEERDSPTVQALREIEYQLRRIGRNVNQIAHNANREMNATIEDEALRLSREQARQKKRNRPTTGDSPLKMGSLWIQTYRLNPSKPSSQESRGFNHGSVNSSLPFCTKFAPLLY